MHFTAYNSTAGLTALAFLLGACGSFGSSDGEPIAPEAGALDGALPPSDYDAAVDPATDAAPTPDAGPVAMCNGSRAGCPASKGCCLESSASACQDQSACDGFFVACQKDADCGGATPVCCLDTVSAGATCVAAGACAATTQRRACTTVSDCGSVGCDALICQGSAGAVVAFISVCAGASTVTVSRGGLSCMVP